MINFDEYLYEGAVLAERYRLKHELGTGGTAVIWLAEDEKAGIDVAMKIYVPQNGLDVEGQELFREEFGIIAQCNHTNLLRPSYYDTIVFPNGEIIPYLVLLYCEKGSTDQLIGQMPVEELWRFVAEVSAGLDYLHKNRPIQIVHQDIKPANVLIDNNNHYIITDFGISHKLRSALKHGSNDDEEIYSNDLSYTDKGTMAYMAPERFDESKDPNPASDIWALGATIYELVMNDVPFGSDGGDTQMRGMEMSPIDNSRLPDANLRNLIKRCLAQNPDERPTAYELVRIAYSHQLDPDPGKKGKNTLWIALAAAVAVCIVALAITLMHKPEDEPIDSDKPTIESPVTENKPDEDVTKDMSLEDRSEAGDAKATYQLSRMYFDKTDGDKAENQHRAHQLMELVVKQDPTMYEAWYELSLDYKLGTYRIDGLGRDVEKADAYKAKAIELAKSAGDNDFLNRIK